MVSYLVGVIIDQISVTWETGSWVGCIALTKWDTSALWWNNLKIIIHYRDDGLIFILPHDHHLKMSPFQWSLRNQKHPLVFVLEFLEYLLTFQPQPKCPFGQNLASATIYVPGRGMHTSSQLRMFDILISNLQTFRKRLRTNHRQVCPILFCNEMGYLFVRSEKKNMSIRFDSQIITYLWTWYRSSFRKSVKNIRQTCWHP